MDLCKQVDTRTTSIVEAPILSPARQNRESFALWTLMSSALLSAAEPCKQKCLPVLLEIYNSDILVDEPTGLFAGKNISSCTKLTC